MVKISHVKNVSVGKEKINFVYWIFERVAFLTFGEIHGEYALHRPLGEAFAAGMAARGIWLHPHHNWYLSSAHSLHDIEQTLHAAEGAMDEVTLML